MGVLLSLYLSGVIFWFAILCILDWEDDELNGPTAAMNLISSLWSWVTPIVFLILGAFLGEDD